MFLENITFVFVSVFLVVFLVIKFIKNNLKGNLVLISLSVLSFTSYITFAIYKLYIPIIYQIVIFCFAIFIPMITILLQYNNIIISRKILYYIMKFKYNSKEYQKALELINKLVLLEGTSSNYLYLMGKCYNYLGDSLNARECFMSSIQIDDKDYKSIYELGLLMDNTNDKNSALEMYEKALKIKPDFYEAWEALGICLTSKGMFKEAVEVYKKAVALYHDSFEMYYNIGMIESELENFEEAIESFEKAGSIKPDLYMVHYNLGKLYAMKKDYDKAIEAYSKILNSTNYGGIGYYNLAIMYANKEEYQRAMTTLEYAMELDEKFLKEAEHEYSFNPFRSMIEDYKKSKEKEKIAKLQKQNLIKQRFRIFKPKEELEIKQEFFEENVLMENHA